MLTGNEAREYVLSKGIDFEDTGRDTKLKLQKKKSKRERHKKNVIRAAFEQVSNCVRNNPFFEKNTNRRPSFSFARR